MRPIEQDEWEELCRDEDFNRTVGNLNAGVIDDYKSSLPGYAGQLIVIVKDQPESINVFGRDGAGRLYKIFSSYD